MPTPIDLTGQRFERLTVLHEVRRGKTNSKYWLCRCDCGTELPLLGKQLQRGYVTSCGCLLKTLRRWTISSPLGESLPIGTVADAYGVNIHHVAERLSAGWSDEEALFGRPPKPHEPVNPKLVSVYLATSS